MIILENSSFHSTTAVIWSRAFLFSPSIENPYDIAGKFLVDNHLGSDMLEQVVEFITKNTSAEILVAPKDLYNPYALPDTHLNDKSKVALYSEANTAGILKKLCEFSGNEERVLSEEELVALNRLLSSSDGQAQDNCQMMTRRLLELVESWHQDHLFPGTVILRFLYNYIDSSL